MITTPPRLQMPHETSHRPLQSFGASRVRGRPWEAKTLPTAGLTRLSMDLHVVEAMRVREIGFGRAVERPAQSN
jgi:hypothetical protein